MKLFFYGVCLLLENILYIKYFELLLKNKKEIKFNRICFIILVSMISLMADCYFTIKCGSLIFSLIYSCMVYYDEKNYIKLIKMFLINSNMAIIKGMCMLILNCQTVQFNLLYFISDIIWFIEYICLKNYLNKKCQLNKKVYFFIMGILIGIITLEIYVLKEYLTDRIKLSWFAYVSIISFVIIALDYLLYTEILKNYYLLINQNNYEQALDYEEKLIEIIDQRSKEYNKFVHDYKKQIKDIKENQDIQVKDILLEMPTEVIHTNNIALNYVFNQYMEIMKNHHIDFYGTYPDKIYRGVSSYDLMTILKLLLDHAIVLSEGVNCKVIHYTLESQKYYTIIKIQCMVLDDIIIDQEFKKREYLIDGICRKYNGKKISKIEDNQYTLGCYLENNRNLL